jgi:hypothetical protein
MNEGAMVPPDLPHYPWQIHCLLCEKDAADMLAYTFPALGNLLVRTQDHLIRVHGMTLLDLEGSVRREVEGGYIWSFQGKDCMGARSREDGL